MKIRYFSDIHNEFRRGREWYPSELEDDKNTVLVLAGDVDVGKHVVPYVTKLSERFKAVVHVLGNHEFYGRNMDKREQFVSDAPNVHLLDNGAVTIDDVQFIGTTLWTDINYANPLDMLNARATMSDFSQIRQGTEYTKFTADRWIEENCRARDFLRKHVVLGEKQVVITHHAPDFICAKNNPYSGNAGDVYYYNNNLTDIIADTSLWIYGHSHHKGDQTFGDMKIVSNPRGYDIPGQPHHLVPGFDELGVIEIW